jgi:hypothetical protein
MIELTPAERAYLLPRIREDLEYYRTLVASSKATQATQAKHRVVQSLFDKLSA